MKTQDREGFAALMAGVGELYGKPLSTQLMSIYWEGLSSYDFQEVKVAVNLHIRNPDTGQFMPKIADVVKFLEGNTLTQAMRAWQKVIEGLRRVGTYATVVFDDPLIHAVIANMGGWQPLGQVSDDELPFKAREFEKRYQAYKIKPPQNFPRALVGVFEKQNNALGYRSPEPVLLGDTDVAQRLYLSGGDLKQIGMVPVGKLASVKP